MIRGNPFLQTHVAEKALREIFPSTHPAIPAYPTVPVNYLQKLDASDFFSSLLVVSDPTNYPNSLGGAGPWRAGIPPWNPPPLG